MTNKKQNESFRNKGNLVIFSGYNNKIENEKVAEEEFNVFTINEDQ